MLCLRFVLLNRMHWLAVVYSILAHGLIDPTLFPSHSLFWLQFTLELHNVFGFSFRMFTTAIGHSWTSIFLQSDLPCSETLQCIPADIKKNVKCFIFLIKLMGNSSKCDGKMWMQRTNHTVSQRENNTTAHLAVTTNFLNWVQNNFSCDCLSDVKPS